ncbi:hypothetical protein [Hymenobacter sp. PAMC 26628]|uniref:hypothetical protein n=1 Tax=Hymenobacter sp. PAMC 26628 TaxID=1484118 RepID=UPI0007700281|nr:hypothetical protein [Hymenobacter sp. PAMC 26628]AMJ67510.1 hypothetical protein AXW84_20370 [Hymenobacter sp. PAMC 26628]
MRPNHFIILGAITAASPLGSCQQTPATIATTEAVSAAATPVPAGASTEAAARAAIGRYLQGQFNANLYVIDSARATDLGAYWQVLVPRTDWIHRMPNRAAFEVNKQTGSVKTLPVK